MSLVSKRLLQEFSQLPPNPCFGSESKQNKEMVSTGEILQRYALFYIKILRMMQGSDGEIFEPEEPEINFLREKNTI